MKYLLFVIVALANFALSNGKTHEQFSMPQVETTSSLSSNKSLTSQVGLLCASVEAAGATLTTNIFQSKIQKWKKSLFHFPVNQILVKAWRTFACLDATYYSTNSTRAINLTKCLLI